MREFLFYGAGGYAHEFGRTLINESGYYPLAFVDSDCSKWGSLFKMKGIEEGFRVISLEEAVKTYSDADFLLVVIPDYRMEILSQLNDFEIPKNRIYILDYNTNMISEDYEYRLGCGSIGTQLIFNTNAVLTCCFNIGKLMGVKGLFNDSEHAYKAYRHYTNELNKNLKDNTPCDCHGCPRLTLGLWNNNPTLSRVGFSSGFYGDSCPASCIYCNHEPNNSKNYKLTVANALENLIKGQYVTKNTIFSFTNAEPLANKDIDKVFDLLETHELRSCFLSSGYIYNERLANNLSNGMTKLLISIDAGTAKTYSIVKQCSEKMFNHVIDNIEKWHNEAFDKHTIELKYIILEGINDNDEDIKGFIDIVKRFKCTVHIANDSKKSKSLCDQSKEYVKRLVEEVNSFNLPFLIHEQYFTPEHVSYFKQNIK